MLGGSLEATPDGSPRRVAMVSRMLPRSRLTTPVRNLDASVAAIDHCDESLVGGAVSLHPEALDAGSAERELGTGDRGVPQGAGGRSGERFAAA